MVFLSKQAAEPRARDAMGFSDLTILAQNVACMNETSPLISTNERRIRAQLARPYNWFLARYLWIYQQFNEWSDEYCAEFLYLTLDDLYRLCLYDPPKDAEDVRRICSLMGQEYDERTPLCAFLFRVADTTRSDPHRT